MEPRRGLGRNVNEVESVSVEKEEASLQYFKILSLYLHKAHRTGIKSPKLWRES